MVSGMGVVGQLALGLAAQCGCETLTALDLEAKRLETAKSMGATNVLDAGSADLKEAVDEITGGRGADLIIEASGYPEALLTAFDLARIGGRIMCLGSIWHRKISVDFMDFHEKELTLVGCHQPKAPTCDTLYYRWTQQHNRRQILAMLADGRLNVSKLITHRLPFTQVEEAYRLLRAEKGKALGIILTY